MGLSKDINAAARELGEALNASPVVQEYLQTRDAIQNDAELQKLEQEIDQTYQELVARQQSGKMLLSGEVNHFYSLRDTYNRHPLVIHQEQCQAAVKALFEQAGVTINSILSVDYTKLVLD